jgi:catechol 2,3-dioxygenase-like lactoylglutathione lyase family enzyme
VTRSTREEEESMIKKTETIALFVHDLDGCTAFYRDTIALPFKGSDPGLAAFDLPGGLMLVLLSPQGAAEVLGTDVTALKLEGEPRGYVAVSVADVDSTYIELKAKGVTFVQLPADKPWGLRMAHFTDPEGNLWEITQEIDASPAE